MTVQKRAFDLGLALILAAVLLLPMLVLALGLWAAQGRPILHGSIRAGQYGKTFRLWKFRTMRGDLSDRGVSGGDKAGRITPWGHWLRRTHLDEVPQLWNILCGQMSFVGPRPPLPDYARDFPQLYGPVLQSCPGLTGLATLVYHRHEQRILNRATTAEETDRLYRRRCIPRKARLDGIHRSHASLALDIAILLRTLRTVLASESPRRKAGGKARPARVLPPGTDLADLGPILGRADGLPFDPEARSLRLVYRDRSVLITGAGGSVGSELCRQILRVGPRRLILFDVSEAALFSTLGSLAGLAAQSGVTLVPVLGSITDTRLLRSILARHGVEVVLHAAAYKHVPMVEDNPMAGLANNVLGTRSVVDAAVESGVSRLVLISSDKAVRPSNVMGASKRFAELIVQDAARRSPATCLSIVRFGNVIGSSGSVIPLFRDQIAAGGPVTLTHDEVTRYFMSLREAAQLVLVSGAMDIGPQDTGGQDMGGAGGPGDAAVYVLDMGAPVRIRDLAVQMIRRAGLTLRDAANPSGDIAITLTGLRRGEKLHEELLIAPGLVTTPHPKVMRAAEPGLDPDLLSLAIRHLRLAVATGDEALALRTVRMAIDRADAPGLPRKDSMAARPTFWPSVRKGESPPGQSLARQASDGLGGPRSGGPKPGGHRRYPADAVFRSRA